MALTASLLTHAVDEVDRTSYATASVSPAANELVLVGVYGRRGGSVTPTVPTVTGNSLTWSMVDEHIFDATGATRGGLWIFAAKTAGATSGAVTMNFGAQTLTACSHTVIQVGGAHLAGTTAQAFIQFVHSTVDLSANTYTLTLAAAGASGNRPFHVAVYVGPATATPRASWTELQDTTGGAEASIESQWRSDAFETSASVTWSATNVVGGTAFEVKERVATTFSQALTATVSSVADLDIVYEPVPPDLVELTPVHPGSLTLEGNGPNDTLQAGNLLPYQVGVDFLGPTIAGPVEPEGYIPVLTPVDPLLPVTGTVIPVTLPSVLHLSEGLALTPVDSEEP